LGRNGETVLMECQDAEVTAALLAGGADPWMVNTYGKNALEIRLELNKFSQKNEPKFYKESEEGIINILRKWMIDHPKPL